MLFVIPIIPNKPPGGANTGPIGINNNKATFLHIAAPPPLGGDIYLLVINEPTPGFLSPAVILD